MKKHVLSVLVGLTISATSSVAYADDLAQVFQLALQNDPTLQQVDAQRRAAQKGIDITKSAFWPQVSFSAGYSRSESERAQFDTTSQQFVTIDAESRAWNAGVSLSQTVFDMNVWDRAALSEKQAYQAEVNYLSTRQQLMIRVVNAYFTVLERMDDLEFATAEKKAIERQLEQTKQRFSVGLTAITDVHEAQAQFDTAIASEIQAKNAVEVAQESLREITGRYHQDLAQLNTSSFSPETPTPSDAQQWVKIAEDKNLQLLVQRVAVEISDEQISLARNGHLPTVSLSADYSTNDTSTTVDGIKTNIPRMDSNSIGLSLNVPLFTGFRTSSEVDQARENFIAASQELEGVRRNVERQVRSAYYDVVAALSTIRAFEQAVVSAESALKATQTGFEVGTRTIVDVLNSTRNLYNARRNLSSARYGYIRQYLALKQASGQISEQDLVAINASLINEDN